MQKSFGLSSQIREASSIFYMTICILYQLRFNNDISFVHRLTETNIAEQEVLDNSNNRRFENLLMALVFYYINRICNLVTFCNSRLLGRSDKPLLFRDWSFIHVQVQMGVGCEACWSHSSHNSLYLLEQRGSNEDWNFMSSYHNIFQCTFYWIPF